MNNSPYRSTRKAMKARLPSDLLSEFNMLSWPIVQLPKGNITYSRRIGCIYDKEDTPVMMTAPNDKFNPQVHLPPEFFEFYNLSDITNRPGVYTWILTTDLYCYASRAVTPYELGSKHYDLYKHVNKPVVLAGEIKIDVGARITYNFNSGTFMTRLPGTQDDVEKYKNVMQKFLMFNGATDVVFDSRELMHDVRTSTEELMRYKNIGFEFTKFGSLTECQRYHEHLSAFDKADTPAMRSMHASISTSIERYRLKDPSIEPVPDYTTWLSRRIRLQPVQDIHYTNYFNNGGIGGRRRRATRKRARRTRKRRVI